MKRIALVILSLVILAAGALAAPATKPVVPARSPQPASRPATKPAETLADPKIVEDFNEKLADEVRGGKAKFDDVIGKLRGMGATTAEPKVFSDATTAKQGNTWYRLELGYPWEWAGYTFFVDAAGVIYKFEFTPAQWPAAPGSDVYDRDPEYKLKPGNKWWIVKGRIYLNVDRSAIDLQLTQARTAGEAGKKLAAERAKTMTRTYAGMKKEAPAWVLKMEEVEAHEWFTPRLTKAQGERIN